MKTNTFKTRWIPAVILLGLVAPFIISFIKKADEETPGVAILLVDTDRGMGEISKNIYGQFLEHINHSVVDGLYAEQVRGQGFEGQDFNNYWKSFAESGNVRVENMNFKNGQKSIRIEVNNGTAGIRQSRFYLESGYEYNGSVWLKPV